MRVGLVVRQHVHAVSGPAFGGTAQQDGHPPRSVLLVIDLNGRNPVQRQLLQIRSDRAVLVQFRAAQIREMRVGYDQAYFVWLLNIEDIYGISARLDWKGRVDAKILVSEMKLK